MSPVEFEKDDDEHMRVISACSNLRARNYKIGEADMHKSRGIAGKIIPAIATTTALVVGAICMELYKILQEKPIEKLSCMTANLAQNFFLCAEPNPPRVTKSIMNGQEFSFTPWDRIDVDEPGITLGGFISMLESRYKFGLVSCCEFIRILQCVLVFKKWMHMFIQTMMSAGVTMLFSDFMNKKKMDERKGMRILDVVESVTGKKIDSSKKYLVLELIVTNLASDEGEDIEIPYVRFRIH